MASRPDPAFSDGLRRKLVSGDLASADAPLEAAPILAAAAVRPANERLGPLSRPRIGSGPAVSTVDASAEPQAGSTARPRVRRKGLLGLLLVAVVVVAVVAAGLVSGRLAGTPTNRAGDVAATTLLHGGASRAMAAGTALANGDEIQVAAGGHATLDLGTSQARLAGGTDVVIDQLSSSAIVLDLRAGRAYSRVVVPAGGSYTIVTGPYRWTASGTAFDLDLTPGPSAGLQVTLLALEHSVAVSGPDAETEVAEGDAAVGQLGSSATTPLVIGPIPGSAFSDPWLIANAQTDEQAGDPIGALAGVALAPNGTPTTNPSPTPEPSAAPTVDVSPSPSLVPSSAPSPALPSPTPTDRPTPTPTPTDSPSPTPTASPKAGISLTSPSCPGGVVLSWSKYAGTGFVRYVTVSSGGPIGATFQSGMNVVAQTANRSITTAVDPIGPSTALYRTFALGSGDKTLAASAQGTFHGLPTAALGPLDVTTDYKLLVWQAQDFAPGCFTEYRINYSNVTSQFFYVSNDLQGNIAIPGWTSGQQATFTVVAIRHTPLGDLVVGDASAFMTTHP
ncbi:MAG TPA: hypothetical protein VIB99_08090 [Candidatus Limnocylindrales bacterium]